MCFAFLPGIVLHLGGGGGWISDNLKFLKHTFASAHAVMSLEKYIHAQSEWLHVYSAFILSFKVCPSFTLSLSFSLTHTQSKLICKVLTITVLPEDTWTAGAGD